MFFKSYSDIENSYNGKFVKKVRAAGYDDPSIEYICFNKIDGSNFQCSIDELGNFVVGSRSNLIGRDENFQGHCRVMKNLKVKEKLTKMKSIISNDFSITQPYILTVFGELCGGLYRHPEVEKVKGAVKIQGRVDYHPDNMWVPFDIYIREPGEDNKTKFILDQDAVVKYCKMVGLPYEIEMFRGTLDECFNFPLNFTDTTGNILWGLPIIEDNISEGVVIKPNKAIWIGNERVIFKNKTSKFKERLAPKTQKEKKEPELMTVLEVKFFNYAKEFITESRFMSVISKVNILDLNDKMFGKVLGMFIEDIWKDFDKEYGDDVKEIENKTEVEDFKFSKVRKWIAKEAIEFMRPYFLKLMEDKQDMLTNN